MAKDSHRNFTKEKIPRPKNKRRKDHVSHQWPLKLRLQRCTPLMGLEWKSRQAWLHMCWPRQATPGNLARVVGMKGGGSAVEHNGKCAVPHHLPIPQHTQGKFKNHAHSLGSQ